MKPFILASGSPRRKELLQQALYSFTVEPSQVNEFVNPAYTPSQVVEQLAFQKAEDVLSRHPSAIVLGSDTIVVCDGEILGKPENEQEARKMLSMLSGRVHQVFTGVSILSKEKTMTYYQNTDVTLYDLSTKEIDLYIRSKEPFDKAGGYGIQGFGAYLVKEISGDYFTVVGLPLAETMRALTQFDIHPQLKS
ncbi:Maf family protein [Bacillus solitudinis]|uniref:Maf family protein n=1 Tax=Bacillus solitudinis TaxID=2014074 RepID=UPI000C237C4E|nr:Maf family protein [Bacillus solitudinis]